eukprot:363382-Chlamydomonas_euryale.AAC.5
MRGQVVHDRLQRIAGMWRCGGEVDVGVMGGNTRVGKHGATGKQCGKTTWENSVGKETLGVLYRRQPLAVFKLCVSKNGACLLVGLLSMPPTLNRMHAAFTPFTP